MSFRTRQFNVQVYADIVSARQCAREMAREVGFGFTDQTRIATAVSELAHQSMCHQETTRLDLAALTTADRRGMECICRDAAWLQRSNDRIVLDGVGRLMDELAFESRDSDTVVVIRKWLAEGNRHGHNRSA